MHRTAVCSASSMQKEGARACMHANMHACQHAGWDPASCEVWAPTQIHDDVPVLAYGVLVPHHPVLQRGAAIKDAHGALLLTAFGSGW